MTTAANGLIGDQASSRRSWPAAAGIVAACLLVTFGAAAIGAQFTPGAWYARLERPPLTPPNWIFGPVWTALYALMGLAAAIVWIKSGWRNARVPLALYALQLALNSLWSVLFFGLHRPDLALVDIAVLWLAIAGTMVVFAKHSKLAAAMLLPYLAWVSFATYLNAGFWWLNR